MILVHLKAPIQAESEWNTGSALISSRHSVGSEFPSCRFGQDLESLRVVCASFPIEHSFVVRGVLVIQRDFPTSGESSLL
jgi:hypothetical protein